MFLQRKTIVKWYGESTLRVRYLNRIIRAKALRFFLRLCLPLFALEKRFNPVIKDQGKRILIIVIGGMGDCLLFDPLFRRLKEKWSNARIDVLTGCFEDMWKRLDSVDNLMFFTPQKFKTPWAYASLFRIIYRNSYDIVAEGIAMVPMRGIWPVFTSLVFEASQAPIRIGRQSMGRNALLRPRSLGFIGREEMSEMAKTKTGRTNTRKNPYLTHIIDLDPPDRRQYHESSQVLKPLGIPYERKKDEPRLRPDPSLELWAEKLLRSQWTSKDDIIVGFTVETTRRIKSWPMKNFVSVLERGISDNLKFVMLALAQQSSSFPFKKFSDMDLLDLSGKTSLGEMMAIISHCNFFLSCDTGPSHIAQAFRIPTIVLFGPSNEMEFGPVDRELHTLILPPGNLKCRPCVLGPCIEGKSCIHSITPEVVYQELMRKVRQFTTTPHKTVPDGKKRPRVLCVI